MAAPASAVKPGIDSVAALSGAGVHVARFPPPHNENGPKKVEAHLLAEQGNAASFQRQLQAMASSTVPSVVALQQIEDLQCPVCTEMAVAAVRMPCGHSCDAACLQHWFMNSIRTVRKLRCPVCRAEPTEVEEAVELRRLVEARIASDPSLEPEDRQACVIVYAFFDTTCAIVLSLIQCAARQNSIYT